MRRLSISPNASVREQIDAHLKSGHDGLFRISLNTADRERLAKHAPTFLAAWESDDPSWTNVATAASIEAERLLNAKGANGHRLSDDGQRTFDELTELRHLFTRNAQIQRQVDELARNHSSRAEGTAERWVDAEGRPVRVYLPGETLADSQPSNGPDLGDIVRAMCLGRNLREVQNAMSEGSVSAGGALVPTEIAASVIDRMRALSVCQKAGQRTVKMPTASFLIAKISADPTLSWAAEGASLGDTAPTLAQVTLTAKTLRGWVLLSRELVEDALNLGEELRKTFARAMAVELDRVSLFGSGSGAEPKGIGAASGAASGTSMGTNGAALTSYDKLVDEWQALADANANVENCSIIMAPRTAATIGKFKASDSQPLQVPPILQGLRRFSTTSVPVTQTQGTANNASTVVLGDFSQLLLGVRSELQVVRSEGFLQTNQIGLGFVLRADVAWTDAVSFRRLYGIIP